MLLLNHGTLTKVSVEKLAVALPGLNGNSCQVAIGNQSWSLFAISGYSVSTMLEFLTMMRYLEKYRYSVPFFDTMREI